MLWAGAMVVVGAWRWADVTPVPFEAGDPLIVARLLGVLALLLVISALVAGTIWLRRRRQARASAGLARAWTLGLVGGAIVVGGMASLAAVFAPGPARPRRPPPAFEMAEARLRLERAKQALAQRSRALRRSLELAGSEAERVALQQQIDTVEGQLRALEPPPGPATETGCNCPPGDPLCTCP